MVKHFLLFYELAPDYLDRRPAFRDEHLKLAWSSIEQDALQLGGALADPADQAVLLFKGPDRSVAEEFANSDPYVRSGLVLSWRVREWTTVVGDMAISQVRPSD